VVCVKTCVPQCHLAPAALCLQAQGDGLRHCGTHVFTHTPLSRSVFRECSSSLTHNRCLLTCADCLTFCVIQETLTVRTGYFLDQMRRPSNLNEAKMTKFLAVTLDIGRWMLSEWKPNCDMQTNTQESCLIYLTIATRKHDTHGRNALRQ